MKLPNGERAVIDIRKLEEYALDPDNPRGRHKARVFRAALGITFRDAAYLREHLLRAVLTAECQQEENDFYGKRFAVDCKMKTAVGEATVRTGWIIRWNETFPRLTTCFVLKEKRKDESEDRAS